MSAGQFCNRDTVIVRKQDSIVEAARLMRQRHCPGTPSLIISINSSSLNPTISSDYTKNVLL